MAMLAFSHFEKFKNQFQLIRHLIHDMTLVFAVAKRENVINRVFEERLYEYFGGILKDKGHYPLAINGHLNHVHLFFELNPKQSVSDIVRMLKANSSEWINENRFLPGIFAWQSGYGGFSYSRSQRKSVINYIEGQREHHRKVTFREEYLGMLENFGIEFKNEFLFEFFE
jgi:putative transposase